MGWGNATLTSHALLHYNKPLTTISLATTISNWRSQYIPGNIMVWLTSEWQMPIPITWPEEEYNGPLNFKVLYMRADSVMHGGYKAEYE